jgi:hypothetical protein
MVVGVMAAENKTDVIVTIGGDSYHVDLTQALSTSTLEISFDYIDFTDPATGYQSTATITPTYDGKTPDGPVAWSVVGVVNPSEPWWMRGPNDLYGLTWGAAADAASYTDPGTWSNNVVGTVPTGPIAQLTDVVGSRTVKVKAETTLAGATYSKTFDVIFGPGPLSIFTSAPASVPYWAISSGNFATAGSYGGDFTDLADTAANFPAAVGRCGGSVKTGAITSNTLVPPHSATFDHTPGSGWRIGDVADGYYDSYFSTTSNLPTVAQLLPVSGYDGTGIPRKWAATAAGWGIYPYATGEIFMTNGGEFYARQVFSGDGSSMNDRVYTASALVVCVGP